MRTACKQRDYQESVTLWLGVWWRQTVEGAAAPTAPGADPERFSDCACPTQKNWEDSLTRANESKRRSRLSEAINCVCSRSNCVSDVFVQSPCRRRTHRGIWRVTRWSPTGRAWSKQWRTSARHQRGTSCHSRHHPPCQEDLPLHVTGEDCVLLVLSFSFHATEKVVSSRLHFFILTWMDSNQGCLYDELLQPRCPSRCLRQFYVIFMFKKCKSSSFKGLVYGI